MANITRYPQPMVTPLSEAVDRLFREAFTWPRLTDAFTGGARFGSNSNLFETDEAYVMQVALPGAKADELQITTHRNVLTLQGKTGVATPEGGRGIWVGLSDGEFREQVTLPGEVDAEKASAQYQDGILTLTLPKAEHTRPRSIKVGSPNAQPAIESAS